MNAFPNTSLYHCRNGASGMCNGALGTCDADIARWFAPPRARPRGHVSLTKANWRQAPVVGAVGRKKEEGKGAGAGVMPWTAQGQASDTGSRCRVACRSRSRAPSPPSPQPPPDPPPAAPRHTPSLPGSQSRRAECGLSSVGGVKRSELRPSVGGTSSGISQGIMVSQHPLTT